jgi:RasGEF domain
MGNYSSASAIIRVLDSELISILSETVDALDDKSKRLLHELTRMFKSASGYYGLSSLQYPYLPCLGKSISTALGDQTVITHPKDDFFLT